MHCAFTRTCACANQLINKHKDNEPVVIIIIIFPVDACLYVHATILDGCSCIKIQGYFILQNRCLSHLEGTYQDDIVLFWYTRMVHDLFA